MTHPGRAALVLAASLALPSCTSVGNMHGITITSMSRNIDTAMVDHRACENFVLTRKQAGDYFLRAKRVDGAELHDEAIIAACSYSGTLLVDGQAARWTIYAAGAGRLYNDTGLNRRYLCEGACCAINAELC